MMLAETSSEAVQKATGRTWEEWLALLDDLDATKHDHKEIVRLVHEELGLESFWWCQKVTVGYEKARGLRVLGQTAGTGFQIGVTKTMPLDDASAWDLVMNRGRHLWLGEGAPTVPFEKGDTYETADGTTGEVRVISDRHIRITYQPTHFEGPSTLQIRVMPAGEKSSIRFHQEKLSGPEAREEMKAHWKKVLAELESMIES